MNLTPKDNPEEFEEHLFQKIDISLFKHKFLNDYVEKAMTGQAKLFDKSVINKTESGWILILHSDVLLIYGENWEVSQFEELKKVVDLKLFTNYLLTGNSELILALIAFFDIQNFSILKERIYHKSKKIAQFKNSKLKIEYGTQKDLVELAEMLQQYYHEEYKGLKDKTIFEMQERIFQVILTRSIYILKDQKNNILSFCTIINPDVGILFTKTQYRKKGFGEFILSFCSNLLLKKNREVFVMTDKNEIASNKVCEKVGFKAYYNYSMVEINFG